MTCSRLGSTLVIGIGVTLAIVPRAVACDDTVDQSQLGIDYGFAYSETTERWQELTPTLPTLGAIELHLMTNWNIYDSMTADVRLTDPSGQELWSDHFEYDGDWYGWVYFDLPAIGVEPGETYRIHVSGYGGAWRGSTQSTYSGFSDPDPHSGTHHWDGYDYAFRTLGTDAVGIDFGPEIGGPANGYLVLTDQLADFGVLFSTPDSEGVLWFGGNSPSSYSYVIHAGWLAGVGVPGGIDPIRIDFIDPVTSVSIRGFDGGGDVDTMTLLAFSDEGELLDEYVITSGFHSPGHVATVSSNAIAFVTVQASGSTSGLFFDDLCFTPAPPQFDCNDNGNEDEDDIASGASLDCNDNGVPDECELDGGATVTHDNGAASWSAGVSVGSRITANRFVADVDGVFSMVRFGFFETISLADIGPTIRWALYADLNGHPGVVLAEGLGLELTTVSLGAGPGSWETFEGEFRLGQPVALEAGEAYWLGLHAPDADFGPGVAWTRSASAPPGSAVAWLFPDDEAWTVSTLDGLSFSLLIPDGDCNGNAVPDACDIADGTSEDLNGDGVPDECAAACPWDLDDNGVVNVNDLVTLIVNFGPCEDGVACFDVTGDGGIWEDDLEALLQNWGTCP